MGITEEGGGAGGGSVPIDIEKYETINVNSDTNAAPYITYLINASSGIVTMTLPIVTLGDERWYSFVLAEDGNHAIITTAAPLQKIVVNALAVDSAEIPSVGTKIIIKANGVDGYSVVSDTRVYDRLVSVTGDVSLLSGYESGGLYVGNLADSQIAVITIQDPILDHLGFWVAFIKHSGENASLRVKTVSGSFDQTINDNATGFTLTVIEDSLGVAQYEIKQDSRPKSSNIAINFLPTDTVSTFEPTAGVLETDAQPEEIIPSIAVTSTDTLNPNSLGFWYNDNKALIGDLAATNILADAQVRLQSASNRSLRIKFKYYQYDFNTDTLGSAVSETSYSSSITTTAFEQRLVSGVLPPLSWAKSDLSSNKLLVIELLAVKSAGGGDNPVLEVRSGGTSPSKTTVNVPVASINHATLGGVVEARTGVPDGHIDNALPLQLPELTTTERDLITPNPGMEIWNTTTISKQVYDGVSWKTVTIV